MTSREDKFWIDDEIEEFRQVKSDAENGDISSQCDLAQRYAMGLGVPENEQKAIMWYRKAAEHGNDSDAIEALIKYHADGVRLGKDELDNIRLYKIFAEYLFNSCQYIASLRFYCRIMLLGYDVKADCENCIDYIDVSDLDDDIIVSLKNISMNYTSEVVALTVAEYCASNDNHTEAIQYYRKALDLGYDIEDFETYLVQIECSEIDNESIDVLKKIEHKYRRPVIAMVIAGYYTSVDAVNDALQYYSKALESDENIDDFESFLESLQEFEFDEQSAFTLKLIAERYQNGLASWKLAEYYCSIYNFVNVLHYCYRALQFGYDEDIVEIMFYKISIDECDDTCVFILKKIAEEYEIPRAIELLADCWENGIAIPRKTYERLYWYRKFVDYYDDNEIKINWQIKIVEFGDADDMYELSQLYQVQEYEEEYLEWLKKAAEQGSGEAFDEIYNYALVDDDFADNDDEILSWYKEFACSDYTKRKYENLVKWYLKTLEKDVYFEHGFDSFLSYCNINSGKTDKFCVVVADCFYKTEWYREAFNWYVRSARLENGASQYRIALMYDSGEGVITDHQEAFKWYVRSAQQGIAGAQYFYGCCLENGNYTEQNINEAFKYYKAAADQGVASAQYSTGACYEYGVGVNGDIRIAVSWYKKAAAQGVADAEYALGLCYESGAGIKKNKDTAIKWFNSAAKQNHIDSILALGDYFYNSGTDYKQAIKWYRKASDLDVTEAQVRLGYIYENGIGIKQSYNTAVRWYVKAATCGNEFAMRRLIRCYENNRERIRVTEEQYNLFSKIEFDLGLKYNNGEKKIGKNSTKAMVWFELAAQHGDIIAQGMVADRYYWGINGHKDYCKAYYWHHLASSNGNTASTKKLQSWYYYKRPNKVQEKTPQRHEDHGEKEKCSIVFSDFRTVLSEKFEEIYYERTHDYYRGRHSIHGGRGKQPDRLRLYLIDKGLDYEYLIENKKIMTKENLKPLGIFIRNDFWRDDYE